MKRCVVGWLVWHTSHASRVRTRERNKGRSFFLFFLDESMSISLPSSFVLHLDLLLFFFHFPSPQTISHCFLSTHTHTYLSTPRDPSLSTRLRVFSRYGLPFFALFFHYRSYPHAPAALMCQSLSPIGSSTTVRRATLFFALMPCRCYSFALSLPAVERGWWFFMLLCPVLSTVILCAVYPPAQPFFYVHAFSPAHFGR
ncbi:MAG: hypothetical protein J3R72DRAFT_236815 [Linnemannia gamsii]|nr:MAG: hypothetical protein J3R72DRAFT_236815 [Linnemannia gamsii]